MRGNLRALHRLRHPYNRGEVPSHGPRIAKHDACPSRTSLRNAGVLEDQLLSSRGLLFGSCHSPEFPAFLTLVTVQRILTGLPRRLITMRPAIGVDGQEVGAVV